MGINEERLKEFILKYISKNKLNARIVNDSVYSLKIEPDLTNIEGKGLLFFKNIKTLGNKIYLYFKFLFVFSSTPSFSDGPENRKTRIGG